MCKIKLQADVIAKMHVYINVKFILKQVKIFSKNIQNNFLTCVIVSLYLRVVKAKISLSYETHRLVSFLSFVKAY